MSVYGMLQSFDWISSSWDKIVYKELRQVIKILVYGNYFNNSIILVLNIFASELKKSLKLIDKVTVYIMTLMVYLDTNYLSGRPLGL